ncbi:hypothetical protein NMY22_g20194 [Coprinellus aureogranulatus]|nr:hypothetical protein NMY22_g20194 [Coprinellus aureogranulatus]
MFSSTAGQNWTSSHIFGHGWEQPGFDDSGWDAAYETPNPTPFSLNGTDVTWEPERMMYAVEMPTGGGGGSGGCAGPVPAAPAVSTGVGTSPSPSDPFSGSALSDGDTGFYLSRGEFAGGLVGVVIGAGVIGALISFLLTRRRSTSGKV